MKEFADLIIRRTKVALVLVLIRNCLLERYY